MLVDPRHHRSPQ